MHDQVPKLKIISGGQTGVDRAGLDAAMALGLEVGGWCPRGRRANDGRVPDRYPLLEMHSDDYRVRTRMNILRSDTTLLLRRGRQTPGSRSTWWIAEAEKKKLVEVELEDISGPAYEYVRARIQGARVLNVAGPSEESRPGIYDQALDFMAKLLEAV